MADNIRHSVAFIDEVTYGTTPTTPAFTPIRQGGFTGGLTKEEVRSQERFADRMARAYRHGNKSVAYDIPFDLSYGSHDALFERLLCGTWNTNVLKCGTTKRSMTVQRHFADLAEAAKPYHRLPGSMVNSLSLEIAAKATCNGTWGFVGRDLALAGTAITGATLAAETTTVPMVGFETGTILTEGGSSSGIISKLSFTANNGMEEKPVIGDDKTLQHSLNELSVEGEVTCYYEDAVMLEKFINQTLSSIAITIPDAAGNSIKFEFPRVRYMGGAPDVSGGTGAVPLAMKWKAEYDSVSGSNIIITRDPA